MLFMHMVIQKTLQRIWMVTDKDLVHAGLGRETDDSHSIRHAVRVAHLCYPMAWTKPSKKSYKSQERRERRQIREPGREGDEENRERDKRENLKREKEGKIEGRRKIN